MEQKRENREKQGQQEKQEEQKKQKIQGKRNYAETLLRLKQRLDSDYDKYLRHTMAMEKEQIIEAAAELLAYQEVHCEMTFWIVMSMSSSAEWPNDLIAAPISEADVVRLLSHENPLKELADKWWFHTMANKADFYGFFNANIAVTKIENESEVH